MLRRSLSLLGLVLISQTALSANNIYVSSCADLQAMQNDLKAYYYLTQDIDCSGFDFSPIRGTFSGALSGKTDANGQIHAIKNLTINADPDSHGGLFEYADKAYFQDLYFENVTVNSDDQTHRALLAANAYNVEVQNVVGNNITITGNVTDISFVESSMTGYTGGLVGNAYNVYISNVHLTTVRLKQHTYAGGLIGTAGSSKIEKSSVKGLDYIWEWQRMEPFPEVMNFGGLIGRADDTTIEHSFATGNIASPYRAGGLIGYGSDFNILNSYARVNVSASRDYAGGLVGKQTGMHSILDHVYAVGLVTANNDGRGVIGSQSKHGDYPTEVTESYFDKDVTKKEYSGDSGSQARSTKRMTEEHDKTFAEDKGWDRNIWKFNNGYYPALR